MPEAEEDGSHLSRTSTIEDEAIGWLPHCQDLAPVVQEKEAGSLFQSVDPGSVEQNDETRSLYNWLDPPPDERYIIQLSYPHPMTGDELTRLPQFFDIRRKLFEVHSPIHHLLYLINTFPPDLSSTRIESDFCSSIVTVQRMSPLRLFKIRQHLGPIILPCL